MQTLTYQDFQPENLVGGLHVSFNLRTEVESFLWHPRHSLQRTLTLSTFKPFPTPEFSPRAFFWFLILCLFAHVIHGPTSPPPPPKSRHSPAARGLEWGGGRIPNSADRGKWRGRRGGLTSTVVQGLAREAAERVTARVGRKRAWLVWGRARAHGGGVRGGPGRCRGDCDEREANAGSAARGQKGETAKERLRRQTEPS